MFESFGKKLTYIEAQIRRAAAISRVAIIATFLICCALVSVVIAFIAICVLVWKYAKERKARRSSHGTAAWAGASDLISSGCLSEQSGVPLGRAIRLEPLSLFGELWALSFWSLSRSAMAVALSTQRGSRPAPIDIKLPDRIPHVGIYGASGSMKTTAFAIQQLLQCFDSSVVLDPKSELAKLTGPMRKKRGHRIVVFDPFGLSGLETAQFNPLLLFRDDPTRIVDNARRLANALVVTTGQETDEFWPKASVSVITATLAFLMAMARPEECNLSRMRDILSSPELTQQMLEMMQQSDACNGLLARLAGQVSQLEGKVKASVFSVANSHTDFLDSVPLAMAVDSTSFDPQELIDGRMTVYVCLPVQRLNELMGIQRVIISTLINLVFDAGEDRDRRVRFLLDESASLGPMDSLYAMIQFGRSYGLRASLLFQSMSQIERCFPQSQKDDFLATTATVICGASDIATAKMTSEWLGQSTEFSHSDQTSQNQGLSTNTGIGDIMKTANWGSSTSSTMNEVGRSLLRPEEVLQLPSHLGIVLLPNVRPVLIEKVPYFVRQNRRIIVRLFTALTDLMLIGVALTIVPAVLWGLTIGRSHPLVQDLFEHLQHSYSVLR